MDRWLITSPPRTATLWVASTLTSLGHLTSHETLVPSWGEDYTPEPVWGRFSVSDWAAVPILGEARAEGYRVVTWVRPWREWLPSLLGAHTGPGWVEGAPWSNYARHHAHIPPDAFNPAVEAVAFWYAWYRTLLNDPDVIVAASPEAIIKTITGATPTGFPPVHGYPRAEVIPDVPDWLIGQADAIEDEALERMSSATL